ncbi:hypothetical protein Bca4012_015705 [Brassica carinata]
MSRCFPFPPPGYVVSGIRDEAMIESIKGEEEKCKKELRRENRKRDKKEKEKKEKKDKKDKKRKERERGEGESEKHSHKRRRKEEEVAKDDFQKNQKKVDVFRKLKESENNCLEKSSLTVERELLQSTSQNSCDSTLNSNEKEKQKVKQTTTLNGSRQNNNDNTLYSNELLPKEKEKQPIDGRHNNNDSESIIRIRLPIRRPKDPELMMTNKDQPCPSRDIKLDSATREQPQHLCSTSAPEHASKPHEEKRKHHTSSTRKHKDKKLLSTTQETYQPSSLCKFCPPSMALQFLNVVENWVPCTIERRDSEDDDECWWLMKKPNSHKFDDTERCKQGGRDNETEQVITSSSLTWPRARLLPEAYVYALPYTVPF